MSPWKTVEVAGSFKALYKELYRSGAAREYSEQLFGALGATPAQQVELYRVSTRQDFGITNGDRSEVFRMASERGLIICPHEVVAVRRDYHNQPKGEVVYIATYPMQWLGGDLCFFALSNGGAGPLLE